MAADVLVNLGTGMAIIGVMIALFLRADSRIDKVDAKSDARFDKVDARFDKVDAKSESRFEKMDTKFDAMARDLADVKVSVARIEGYLQARDGFAPAGTDRPASPARHRESSHRLPPDRLAHPRYGHVLPTSEELRKIVGVADRSEVVEGFQQFFGSAVADGGVGQPVELVLEHRLRHGTAGASQDV